MMKFPYRRGHKKRTENIAAISLKKGILMVPKDSIFIKVLEAEAQLKEVSQDEEEALLITELLSTAYRTL